jgi:hypothetical protein
MKRKMLGIVGLLGICFAGSVNQPALAATYPFCSTTYCATANPDSFCTCPPGTEAYSRVGPNAYTECDNYTWRAACNYL